MAVKNYWVKFGSQDPRTYTGLTPSFILFFTQAGATTAPPAITEILAGSGIYGFQYTPAQSTGIAFLIDGGSTVTSNSDRYVTGVVDPIQAVDDKIGFVADSFGSTLTDPTSLMGYVRRLQELFEGNAGFNKTTGVWDIYSRGSSVLLREKTLTNAATTVTKA